MKGAKTGCSIPTWVSKYQVKGIGVENHFLNLLTMFLLIQPTMLLAFIITGAHCWLMFKLLSARTPVPFSKAATWPVSPQPVLGK